MASRLECVGLAVKSEDEYLQLLGHCRGAAKPLGRVGTVDIVRWQDPSGVRLVFGIDRAGAIVDAMPSFAALPEVLLAGIRFVNYDAAIADIVDDDGEQYGQLAVELEQRRLLGEVSPGPVAASLVALGTDVEVFPDAAAFATSDASLLVGDSGPTEERPPDLREGVAWPLRVDAASFLSYGVWNSGDAVEAHARFAGVVESAEVRTVALTGQQFIAARVRSLFDATICLPADGGSQPVPGAVIAGTVFMVGSLDEIVSPPAPIRRSQFRRRR